MKPTQPLNGQHFGELSYMRGLVSYRVSPMELKAFPSLGQSVISIASRVSGSFLKIVPPFVLAYMIFSSTEQEAERLKRKNPADYVNDK